MRTRYDALDRQWEYSFISRPPPQNALSDKCGRDRCSIHPRAVTRRVVEKSDEFVPVTARRGLASHRQNSCKNYQRHSNECNRIENLGEEQNPPKDSETDIGKIEGRHVAGRPT